MYECTKTNLAGLRFVHITIWKILEVKIEKKQYGFAIILFKYIIMLRVSPFQK